MAIGGFDGQTYLDTVEVYEDAPNKSLINTEEERESLNSYEDKWLYASSMKTQRLGGGVGVFSLNKEALATCISHHDDDQNLNTGSVCLADLGYDFL